jgi:hypothetical protein
MVVVPVYILANSSNSLLFAYTLLTPLLSRVPRSFEKSARRFSRWLEHSIGKGGLRFTTIFLLEFKYSLLSLTHLISAKVLLAFKMRVKNF